MKRILILFFTIMLLSGCATNKEVTELRKRVELLEKTDKMHEGLIINSNELSVEEKQGIIKRYNRAFRKCGCTNIDGDGK